MMKYFKLKEETPVLDLTRNKKRETHTELLIRKKKIVFTGDSMVNGISEKGLSLTTK